MVKNIVKGEHIFKTISEDCTIDDKELFIDMSDTLAFNRRICLGMAANMIGVNKRAIVLFLNNKPTVMVNPVIIKTEGKYETEEGCLSLDGSRKCARYRKIKVEWLDTSLNKRIKNFTDLDAQVIQHEIDHLNGIII